jgi:hypothetical protein
LILIYVIGERMGFSVAWLAVPEKAKVATLTTLGLRETDVREDMPESPLLGSDLATGWYLLWFDEISPAALKPEFLRMISSGTELITCQVGEHAMCSIATHWVDGAERWFVAHDFEDGLTSLEVIGSPPAALDAILTEHMALQQGVTDVDYVFDVPVVLAETIVGFRHDRAGTDADSGTFTVLAPR